MSLEFLNPGEEQGGYYRLCCDEDSCENFSDADQIDDLLANVKSEGWSIAKRQDRWHHACPECSKKL